MEKLRYRRIGLQEDGCILIKPFVGLSLSPNDIIDLKTILVIDVETTGLNSKEHKIIELGYLKLQVSMKTGKIVKVLKEFNGLEDPQEKLDEQIIRITGITDKDLEGQKIDWDEVDKDMESVDFCVAHNSKFDRPFVEEKIDSLKDIPWTCSIKDLDWDDWNFPKKNQESLCEYHGFYFVGHRAINDTKALAELLQQNTPLEDMTYFQYLNNNIDNKEYLLIAKNTPFDSKSIFNLHNFMWEANTKFWYKYFRDESECLKIENELTTKLAKYKSTTVEKVVLNSKNRFKDLTVLSKTKSDNKKVLNIDSNLKTVKEYIIFADNTPYETKDFLKARGYMWNKDSRAWYTYVSESESETEKDWLRDNIYPNNLFKGRVISNSNFKK
jgi:DNA polymerase-3 subunit epsilon